MEEALKTDFSVLLLKKPKIHCSKRVKRRGTGLQLNVQSSKMLWDPGLLRLITPLWHLLALGEHSISSQLNPALGWWRWHPRQIPCISQCAVSPLVEMGCFSSSSNITCAIGVDDSSDFFPLNSGKSQQKDGAEQGAAANTVSPSWGKILLLPY